VVKIFVYIKEKLRVQSLRSRPALDAKLLACLRISFFVWTLACSADLRFGLYRIPTLSLFPCQQQTIPCTKTIAWCIWSPVHVARASLKALGLHLYKHLDLAYLISLCKIWPEPNLIAKRIELRLIAMGLDLYQRYMQVV
jgi:hypothetical protein